MMNNGEINPGLVIWEITLKCNLKCKHCGSSAGRARNDELTIDECLKICDDLAEIGFRGVTLFGGEPFLRDDWYIMGKKIKDLGMKLSVVTNGFVDPDDIIPRLIELGVDSVQVGLDGTSEVHDYIRGVKGSFSRAIDFLRLLKDARISSGAITTVSKMNFKELPKLRDLIFSEGFDWQVQEAIPIGRFPKDMALSEEEYYSLGLFIADCKNKFSTGGISVNAPHNMGFNSQYLSNVGSGGSNWNGCWAGKMILGIQSNGGIKGCLALSDDFIEGNLRDRSIVDIWNDSNFCSFNRSFKKEDLGRNCMDCKYGESCKGGCSTRSHSFTGRVRNDPYCFHRVEKEIIRK